MQIIITIPEENEDRVLNSFAGIYGYEPGDGTKKKFFRKQINSYIKEVVSNYESEISSSQARRDAMQKVKTEITITTEENV